MKHSIGLALIASLACSSPSMAEEYNVLTNSGFVESCKTIRDQEGRLLFPSGYCLGMISGIQFAMYAAGSICLPDEVTTEQGVDAVIGYAATHPEASELRPPYLVATALREAWECRKPGAQN